jgi:transaldolase
MGMNPLVELNRAGQSVWLDFVSRDLLNSGGLERLIREDGITGVTSNPSIFQKAISGSADYDGAMKDLIGRGVRGEKAIFLALAMGDIAQAAEQLRGVYDSTDGKDGFVSIEVSPDLAYNTDETIREAEWIYKTLERPNVLIKVPGTREGLPAIEELISAGVNVNVTLLFSVERYVEVAEAYVRGLERRAGKGEPLKGVASVASFFVSRVDTLIDKLLSSNDGGSGLMGKAAVANAQAAYLKGREIFSSSRFVALKEKGAELQRLLWGSTSTKNPAYSDIKYVEELIAPDSINTMPEETIAAFRDHGKARVSIEDGIGEVEAIFKKLASAGIDMQKVTGQLEEEGVKAFSDAFFALLKEIAQKRDALV